MSRKEMNKEEIENRLNHTKNILHKCGLEGQININLMISDIEYLLNEIKILKDENKKYQGIEEGTTIIYKSKAKYVREDRIEKYYVDKNKIREKIKELEKIKNTEVNIFSHDFLTLERTIKVLQELLEEKNDE